MLHSIQLADHELAKREITNIRARLRDIKNKIRCKSGGVDHKTLSIKYREMQKRLEWIEMNYTAIKCSQIEYLPQYLPKSLPFWLIIDGEDEAIMLGAYLNAKEASDQCLSINKTLAEKSTVISNKDKIRMELDGKCFIYSE
ncbi:hypothetical protein ACX9Q3_002101 [Klebsiella oxytoca]|uniref:hypothetical protein n=1 Tax=Klebsiella pneumoniae complex TaxID=3390273 RepID=UPI0019344CFB|nr:hypothetical protein [Klebsiella pneumoniae]HBL0097733.1 hypothetical protein [Escherichia coli]HBR1132691.1 hypothetical protein [Klebsiella quasipneumoniae subsp. similipneumoniae]EKM7489210.1 hypothetical protein [Klebsiella pneumoniae]EKZ6090810.1 hypothetical protein [Klebsiella pneumoniae]MBD7382477.1 hypothetical protein [Klebsiella pneumoniae]